MKAGLKNKMVLKERHPWSGVHLYGNMKQVSEKHGLKEGWSLIRVAFH